jgi:hypothetical protein
MLALLETIALFGVFCFGAHAAPAGGRFHLYFEDKMNAHMEKAARDRRLQISHQSGDVSTESLNRFFADHVKIGPEQLVPAFVRHQPEARYSFHHFQQRVKGYNVQYGGIIAMIGSHEEVMTHSCLFLL